MSDYVTAITEIRQILADTKFNKRGTKKTLIGNADGTNTKFYSYDKRLFTDQIEVYVNNALVSNWDLNDAVAGEFIFSQAPDANAEIRASYYWQWWTDSELKNFLNKGAEQLGVAQQTVTSSTPDTSYLKTPVGLKTPVLKFACHLAWESLISYLIARKHSAEYLVEQDGNVDEGYSELIKSMQDQSKNALKDALALTDRYYKRQGRQFAPSFGIKNVNTKQYGPRR